MAEGGNRGIIVAIAGIALGLGAVLLLKGKKEELPTAETHLACQGGICTRISGAGADECPTESGVCGGTPTHTECISDVCTEIDGVGTNQCTPIGSTGCQPPPPSLSCTLSTPFVNNQDVSVDVGITDNGQTPFQSLVNWGDGSPSSIDPNFPAGTTRTFTHTYSGGGTFTIELHATDNNGTECVRSRTVTVSGPPTTHTVTLNVVEDGTSTPLPGTITIMKNLSTGDTFPTRNTDANGRATYTFVPTGTYEVKFRRSDYLPTTLVNLSVNSDINRTDGMQRWSLFPQGLVIQHFSASQIGGDPTNIRFMAGWVGGDPDFQVDWSFDDGTSDTANISSNRDEDVSKNYVTPGTYSPTVVVTDANADTRFTFIDIDASTLKVFDIAGIFIVQDEQEGGRVDLYAHWHEESGSHTYDITIDWGDGTIDTTTGDINNYERDSHRYLEPRTYNILYTIRNNNTGVTRQRAVSFSLRTS